MATQITSLVHSHPRTTLAAIILALGAPAVINNYRKYLALGTSGLTRLGPLGWFIALSFTALGRETVSTGEYEQAADKGKWLDIEVERRGTRPTTGWHCVPHRQLDRLPKDEIAKRLEEIFDKHAAANPTLVQMVPCSPHEKLDPGMVIHPDIPTPHKYAEQALREIAHVHPTDHSLHVVLSPVDCKTAIDLGWAERHPLSGVSRVFPLPSSYLLVYAPRDEEELEVVERIIVASIGYMTGSRSVA